MNLLVVPGTNRIALEILRSLRSVKGIRIIGAGTDMELGAKLPYENFHYLEPLNMDSEAQVLRIIRKESIDLVFFAHDSWILRFANISSLGQAVIVKSSSESINVCSFKSKTYDYFEGKIPTPRIFRGIHEIESFPIFVKPDRGQGSVGARIIESREAFEALFEVPDETDLLFCEFVPGAEFTVDCFSNRSHKVIYLGPRQRGNYELGMSQKTWFISETNEVKKWADEISTSLSISGAWFFQFKLNSQGIPLLLEIGLRIGGASGINRLRGVNLSLMNLHLFSASNSDLVLYGQDSSSVLDQKLGFVLGFEYKGIYVDLDDTLIINGGINLPLLDFLTQSPDKEISLITRNLAPYLELERFGIRKDLFDKVLIVLDTSLKSSYIDVDSSFIFIDDSHKERLDVKNRFGNFALVLDQSFCWQGDVFK